MRPTGSYEVVSPAQWPTELKLVETFNFSIFSLGRVLEEQYMDEEHLDDGGISISTTADACTGGGGNAAARPPRPPIHRRDVQATARGTSSTGLEHCGVAIAIYCSLTYDHALEFARLSGQLRGRDSLGVARAVLQFEGVTVIIC